MVIAPSTGFTHVAVPSLDFNGSIAPVVQLAEMASRMCPGRKYVIILDEFDEIHPELYMHGNLAETFFGNIRAIATCDNVCTILIGGENMSFVMDRQGQKLNKFARVALDYYSRDKEWDDFKLLVEKPTLGQLDWHEDAITEVFNVSNGNPYFAKAICAGVFSTAVEEHDSDITFQEVKRAIASDVPTFGTITLLTCGRMVSINPTWSESLIFCGDVAFWSLLGGLTGEINQPRSPT
jgi:hypothetical protein